MKILKQTLTASMLAGSILALSGCAQQVGDIDRTSPNKVSKSIFDDGGEWYVRSTVVEVPGTAVSSFAGLQGEMNRVRWEITEDHLIAFRTNEDVLGIDTNLYNPETDGPFQGAPVAAFPIQSHFDVQRAYNSATGEQTNVITENGSDRNWYEREFMRVSWDRNSAPIDQNFDPAVEMQRFAGLQIAPQDAGLTPDKITWRIEQNDKGEVNYIDVLNTYVFEPSWIDCVLTFGFPLYGGDCGAEVVKVRTSFLKIDPSQDGQHEPRVYDDLELDKFGFFRTERCIYDRTYGCRDSTTIKLANIWRIWKDARNADGSFKPYEQRTPRPFAYYVSANFPADLAEANQQIADQWNNAYVDTVKHYHPNFTGRIFYLCSNPGLPTDPGYAEGVCERPGEVKELGDLRYSFLSWIDQEQQQGPLGYGPSSADPLTGEIVNGNANIYGAAIDRYAQYILDILMLTTGDLDPNEFAYGLNVKEYVEELKSEGIFLGYNKTSKTREASIQNVKERILNKDGKIFELVDSIKGLPMERRIDLIRPEANRQTAVWPKLRGTELERLMVNDDIKVGFGRGLVNPGDSVDLADEEMADLLSPAKIGTMKRVQGEYDRRLNKFSSRNMMMVEFFDGAYLGLALEMKAEMEGFPGDKFEKLAHARKIIRERLYKGVMEHEVGHTLGLRHNFEGSFDSINFDPKYWEMRFIDYDLDGQVDPINAAVEQNPTAFANTKATEEGLTGAARDARIAELVGNIQAAQRRQLENKLSEFQLSSIMDYGAKLNSDFHGIGLYDHAAIKYGYGELIEVFDVAPTKVAVDYGNDAYDSMQPTDDPIVTFDDIDNVTGALAPDDRTEYVDGDFDEHLDNDLDFYHYGVLPILFSGMSGDMSNMYKRSTMTVREAQQSGKVQVPYRFCSDEYRGGTPTCDVWDAGASFEEVMDTHIQGYNQYYIFNNFRRDRAAWGLYLWPIFQRFVGRYFGPMANIYQHWVLRLFFNDSEWYLSEWGGQLGWAGIERGLGTMMQTLVSPNPGTYGFNPATNEYENISSEIDYRFRQGENTTGYTDFFNINIGEGKYDTSRYDYDSGYYYFLRYEILTSFFERWAAMMALTNAETNFIGVDGASDITAFAIPVTLLYSEELYRWFGALINGDMKEIAPLFDRDETDKMGITLQNPLASSFLRSTYRNRIKVNPFSGSRDFNMEIFSAAYSLGMFQDRYDRSFNALANVQIIGRGESYEIADGFETIDWTDPTTGITYLAARGDFTSQRGLYPTGWNMVKKAKELEAKWRVASCPPENDGVSLEGCNVNNSSEYFEMTGHRETLDTLVITNRVFDNYNDTSWIVD